ncbi:scarecrow-like protein 21 isoform X1 [Salvia hispanica]|uniref:scarecrow-like protein 21 isoform X1 n=2 Tax=Salvia hispanica TaxID=49212 RepID=UPI002008F883|nr:scarecrow-like protein 21 isoform X1 [Salvia hispanica]
MQKASKEASSINSHLVPSKNQDTELSFQACAEPFYTLESTPMTGYAVFSSPTAVSVSSSKSPFSPQLSHSYASDVHHSSENSSSLNGSFEANDESNLAHSLWLLSNELLGPECGSDYNGSLTDESVQPYCSTRYHRIVEMAPDMDLKHLLIACAEVVSEADIIPFSERRIAASAAETLMDIIQERVSVSGDPLQRLGAYILEALRARLLSSGSLICKKLKCDEPSGPDLMSHMQLIAQICPFYKFAYMAAGAVIGEAMENEKRIHIIDFQIAQGSQWLSFIQAVSRQPDGPPYVRITGVDDSESAHARGGGLEVVGQRLSQLALSCGVPFEFHGAGTSGSDVKLENLNMQHGEALAVNFPYVLHHIPDESVSTSNHRDRLLRLVKSLSPKVMTLVEQESNTNTATFSKRFRETLEYYAAMFECIDAAGLARDEMQRINAEEHCVAKDVVSIIACEGNERMERHEVFGKWRSRLRMAGFSQIGLSPSVTSGVRNMLKEYSPNYALAEADGAVCIRWKNKALVSFSAWR